MGTQSDQVTFVVNVVPSRRGTTRHQHARRLCESFETTIVSRGPVPDEIRDDAVAVRQFRESLLSGIPVLFPFWLWYWIVRLRASAVVVGPYSLSILIAYAATRLTSSSLVVDLWDDLTLPIASYDGRPGLSNRFKEWYHRVLFRGAAHVLPTADLLVLSIHPGIVEKYDLASTPVVKLTNGYLPSVSDLQTTPEDDDSTRFVYLGRANSKRGIDTVIRTVADTLPESRLDIVGPTDEAVERAAAEFESVTLYGERPYDEALDIVARADVCLCILDTTVENYRYSYPIKLFEYAALGKAIIASDTLAIRTILTSDQSVCLVDDTAAVRDAITRFASDESLRRRLGEQARSDVRSYAWPNILDRYEDAIRDVIGDDGRLEQ
jgi:glycosyltransferase involved in cell wall biosynthesis